MSFSKSDFLPVVALLFLAACGSSTTPADAASDSAVDGPSDLAIGQECDSDAQCGSGVCWDFSERDALCGGTVCSMPCETDVQCEDAARGAGSDNPAAASCDSTGECDFVGALGSFFCA